MKTNEIKFDNVNVKQKQVTFTPITFDSTEQAISTNIYSINGLQDSRTYWLDMANDKSFSADDRVYFATQAQFCRECIESKQ